MKNIIILSSMAVLLLLSACNKDRNEKSELRFGNKTITTRNVKGFFIAGVPELSLSEKLDGKDLAFSIGFNVSRFPKQGTYRLSFPGGSNDEQVPTGFFWGGEHYLTDRNNNTILEAYDYKDKGKYVLSPTWFFSYHPDPVTSILVKGNDSVLVSGTIYEPKDITVR